MTQRYLPSDVLNLIEQYQKYNKINDEILDLFLHYLTANARNEEWFEEMNELLQDLKINTEIIVHNEGYVDYNIDRKQILTNRMIAPIILFVINKFGYKDWMNDKLEELNSDLRIIKNRYRNYRVVEIKEL